MILHIGYEIPVAPRKELNAETEKFTPEESKIVKTQIRKNRDLIDDYIRRIDLFVNKERHPHREAFVEKLRDRLFLLIEENDTFRKVLWKQETMGGSL